MSESRFGPIADRIAAKQGIPPQLFRSLIGAESSWNPTAGSSAGARGLAQLMPATARGLGVRNVLDPVQNMTGGAKYLRQQYDRFKRWDLALAAYNAGPGAVERYGGIPPYRETQNYVPKVLGSMSPTAGTWNPRQQAGRARAPRQAGVGAAPPPGADAQTPNPPPFDQVTPGTIRPGRVAIAPSTLAMMQRYANESEAAVMQGQSPPNADLLGTMLEFDMTPPVFTPGQIIPGQQPRENARVGAVQSPPAAPSPRDRGTVPVARTQSQPRLTMGGGPDAHHSRALGNWQSDDAYDLMAPAGTKIISPVAGRVTNVSGQPGGSPGFAGYGITVDTGAGQFFFKHLGTKTVKIGDRIKPGQLLGTLDAATAGGPHLHLGGTNLKLLAKLARWYTNGGR